jgi:hypothetical protein
MQNSFEVLLSKFFLQNAAKRFYIFLKKIQRFFFQSLCPSSNLTNCLQTKVVLRVSYHKMRSAIFRYLTKRNKNEKFSYFTKTEKVSTSDFIIPLYYNFSGFTEFQENYTFLMKGNHTFFGWISMK